MNRNFTLNRFFIIFTAAFLFAAAAKADNNPPTLSFTATPVLVSGTNLQVGAVYKFSNVVSGTNALVTIVNATGGASVVMIDDNSLTKPEAFSPQVKVPANSTGMVEFRIDFVNGSGNPKSVSSFYATAMDIDGFATLHEMDALNMGAGSVLSYQSGTLEISMQHTGNEYLATNIAGNEYTGVDTAAKQVMFTLFQTNLTGFTYRAGANNQNSYEVTRQKGIYFKGFDYLAFLPVRYSAFEAVADNSTVNLKWVTETEVNNHHFEIERSFDGRSFQTIGLVKDGAISSNTGKSYQYRDNSSALADVNLVYYRLKQVDADGKFSYSGTLVVRMGVSNVTMQVSPNPFLENLDVRFTSVQNGTAQVQVLTMNGQKVQVQQAAVGKGNNTIQLQGMSKLAPGIYMAQLVVNGVVTGTQKIIKN